MKTLSSNNKAAKSTQLFKKEFRENTNVKFCHKNFQKSRFLRNGVFSDCCENKEFRKRNFKMLNSRKVHFKVNKVGLSESRK